jgi:hypothetical protein
MGVDGKIEEEIALRLRCEAEVPPVWLPFRDVPHLNVMTASLQLEIPPVDLHVRKPPEPSPPPIKEPPDAPENPDASVREPDPDEPAQM